MSTYVYIIPYNDLPMQAFPEANRAKSGGQTHSKLPSLFIHSPNLHISSLAHSSISVQLLPSSCNTYPIDVDRYIDITLVCM